MARDIYHRIVKTALIADGWEITADPYLLRTEFIEYEADLGAEKLLAASQGTRKVLIEVKSFLRQSKSYEMHAALGQYNTYQVALEEQEPDRELYLAVTETVFREFMRQPFIQKLLNRYHVNLLVFDPVQTHIAQWIPA